MADLIKMDCQGCGAPLQVGRDLLHAVCPYCHTDNILKASEGRILEAHSQCPICHRNDRTKKVSAIMASGGENARYFSKPQKPVLNQTLASPPPPIPQTPVSEIVNSSGTLKYAYIAAFALAGLALICTVSSFRNNSSYIIFVIIFGVAGFFLYRKYKTDSMKNNQTSSTNQSRMNSYQEQVNRYHQDRENDDKRKAEESLKYQKWIAKWELAVEKWTQLYYCDRDDCVFIPGRESTAALKDIEKFCYQTD
jgi:predicted RNA-binding Zn-ribbon protein involved in translation (DUF1610 family)